MHSVHVCNRNHSVAICPRRWWFGTATARYEPIPGTHPLTGDVDDRSDGVHERTLGPGVGEASPALPDLSPQRVGPKAELAEEAAHRSRHAVDLGREDHRQHVLAPRCGDEAEERAHLLAEPAAGDQHQPLAHLGELVGELHGHTAAEAVADERGPLDVEHDEEVADARRVGAQAVVAAGLGGLAVAQQVRGDRR